LRQIVLPVLLLVIKTNQILLKNYLQLIAIYLTFNKIDPHGETWVQIGLPGCETSFSLAGFQGIICETDHIEKEIKELEAKRVQEGKIDDTPWGKFAWLKDIDRNSLCLHQK
jgi:hypothetical protein